MKLTGAEIIVECLLEQGVDTVFGFPGGAVLNIYDALYKYSDKICHVLTSHEQGAAHAADGYARSSGKVGVVIATSGPGATNLVTGIATAYMDSVPLVAITGNVALPLLGRDSFQEVDITGITMPVTKHNYIVKDVNQLAEIIREAFTIAKSGRPGPVLIDIPKDITAAVCDYVRDCGSKTETVAGAVDTDSLKKAAELINNAKKPIIYAGGGVIISNASDELLEFSGKADIPVCSSIMAMSAMNNEHPLFIGMIGMHGDISVARAINECDLCIAIGARFSDRVAAKRDAFAPKAKILHLDIDAAEIGKNISVSHYCLGDIKEILAGLIPMINKSDHSEWRSRISEWAKEAGQLIKDNTDSLCPKYILSCLSNKLDNDAVIVTDVGQHQMWAAQYYKFKSPRTFLTSGGLGTMGYGMGAAIGAKTAKRDKQVVLVTGDGSFHMNMNELATCVSQDIPIVIVLFNNSALGMVRQWQKLFYQSRFSQTSPNRQTDYLKLAEAFGAVGYRVTEREEFPEAIEKALANKKVTLIECVISEDECVLPMIPPGGAVEDIILEL